MSILTLGQIRVSRRESLEDTSDAPPVSQLTSIGLARVKVTAASSSSTPVGFGIKKAAPSAPHLTRNGLANLKFLP